MPSICESTHACGIARTRDVGRGTDGQTPERYGPVGRRLGYGIGPSVRRIRSAQGERRQLPAAFIRQVGREVWPDRGGEGALRAEAHDLPSLGRSDQE